MSLSRAYSRERALRLGALVVGSTTTLTMSFFGIVAVATASAGGALNRLPYYLLAGAAAFVVALLLLEEWRFDAETVLEVAGAVGVGAFLVVGLAIEGAYYVSRYPDAVVSSQLFVYVLSAGLIATGIGFWTARHYRELKRGRGPVL